MGRDTFVNSGASGGRTHGFLGAGLVGMVTSDVAGPGVVRDLGGWENVLPAPFSGGVRKLAFERVRQHGAPIACLQVALMDTPDGLEMFAQLRMY